MAELPGAHVVPVIVLGPWPVGTRLPAGVAGPDQELRPTVPGSSEVLTQGGPDTARIVPVRVDGQQPIAPERDRLAMLTGQPGPDRGGPLTPIR